MPWSDWITDPALRVHTVPRDQIATKSVSHANNFNPVGGVATPRVLYASDEVQHSACGESPAGYANDGVFYAAYNQATTDLSYEAMINTAGNYTSWNSLGPLNHQNVKWGCEWRIVPPMCPCSVRWRVRFAMNARIYDTNIYRNISWYSGQTLIDGKYYDMRRPDHIDTLAFGQDYFLSPELSNEYMEYAPGYENTLAEFISIEFSEFGPYAYWIDAPVGMGGPSGSTFDHPAIEEQGSHDPIEGMKTGSHDIYLVHANKGYWDESVYVGPSNPADPSSVATWRLPWEVPDGSSNYFMLFDGMQQDFGYAEIGRQPDADWFNITGAKGVTRYSRGPYSDEAFKSAYIADDGSGSITFLQAPAGFRKGSLRPMDVGVFPTPSSNHISGRDARLWYHTKQWMGNSIQMHNSNATSIPNTLLRIIIKLRVPPYRYWIPDTLYPDEPEIGEEPADPRPPLRLTQRSSQQLSAASPQPNPRIDAGNTYW